jgi:gamma-glutamyl hercynylcysteine S-oxide synthase
MLNRISRFAVRPLVALAGLGGAVYAGSQDHWLLGGTALSVGLGALALPRRRRAAGPSLAAHVGGAPRELVQDQFAARLSQGDDVDRFVADLLRQGRVALLLRPQLASSVDEQHLEHAQAVLDDTMSLVPEGDVVLNSRWLETGHADANAGRTQVTVDSLFLDRFAVSNRDYRHFVDAGGYKIMELWEPAIWPAMGEFIDQSGQVGPRYWSGGKFPRGLDDHPVVGVSWYEASAYARWVGKRLPSDAEWIKAGVWPVFTGGAPQQRRYPWGDAFDRARANVWGAAGNATVPVDDFADGASVGGVYQLVGNVWEWTATQWGVWEPPSKRAETASPMRALRGGAFDTYFDCQAACQFQSGDDPLARRRNVGFRCALSWADVAPETSPQPSEEAT